VSTQIVVCNAGPLIALGKLNRLHLLADLYGEVQIPQAVYREVVTEGIARGAADAVVVRLFWKRQGWPVVDVLAHVLSSYTSSMTLDPGETEVLALAQTLDDPLVLLDDQAARSEARRLGLRLRGTLGVLVQVYREGVLPFAHVELLIQEIAARTDIWISAKLCRRVLSSLRKSSP
jgi:predicted nucleic acid-binding protein